MITLSPLEYGIKLLGIKQNVDETFQLYVHRVIFYIDKAKLEDGYIPAMIWYNGLHDCVRTYIDDQIIKLKARQYNRSVSRQSVLEPTDTLATILQLFTDAGIVTIEKEFRTLFEKHKKDVKKDNSTSLSKKRKFDAASASDVSHDKGDVEIKRNKPVISNPCRYCGKQYFNGHKCNEFYRAKDAKAKREATINGNVHQKNYTGPNPYRPQVNMIRRESQSYEDNYYSHPADDIFEGEEILSDFGQLVDRLNRRNNNNKE